MKILIIFTVYDNIVLSDSVYIARDAWAFVGITAMKIFIF